MTERANELSGIGNVLQAVQKTPSHAAQRHESYTTFAHNASYLRGLGDHLDSLFYQNWWLALCGVRDFERTIR